MRDAAVASLVASVCLLTACSGSTPVRRAYGPDVVDGRFIAPEAYASFLSGSIAEASGDLRGALASYEATLQRDPRSPEVWTRIGEVRCRVDAHDHGADEAFAKALEHDPGYARAWAAKARCLTARGDAAGAREAAAQATRLDATADGANVMLAPPREGPSDAPTRERLVALTMTAVQPRVAWDALAAWAKAHGDVALWARALRELVRSDPSVREVVAGAAEELAGMGALAEARAVAEAAVEAADEPLGGTAHALARRLAVDHVILSGDTDKVRNIASRARLSLDEAAGRALLSERREMARSLAEIAAAGDPTARGARLVLAVCTGRDLLGAGQARPEDVAPSSAASVVYGAALADRGMAREARETLATLPSAIVSGDDRVVRASVELVSRGVLTPSALPPDGVIELAALRGEPFPPPLPRVDERHEYLALSLSGSNPARARELGLRLTRFATIDPVIHAAQALLPLASGSPIPRDAPRALLTHNPGDPLLAAVALRLAEKVGDTEVVRQARATLAALAGKRDVTAQ
jgi:tetratricopeptide (TPR) repeat protein